MPHASKYPLVRQRWAAIGAAVAVSLGGGATWLANAAGNSAPSSLITIVPCRLMDTRPGVDNVGSRRAPLGQGEAYAATVWGTNGDCTIPTTATAVVMNVTAVKGTAASFLSIYPADADRPLVSSLNWAARQGATPNGVTVRLSTDGKVAFYNQSGGVDVIADIVGYYETASSTVGPQGPKGDKGDTGDTGLTGAQGPVGPLPTVRIASQTNCCFAIAGSAVGEANAKQVLLKGTAGAGAFLVRLDAQLNNFGALWFDYHCKLQSLSYPALLGTPFSDIPGTRRDVSWRTGKDSSGNGTSSTGVSISMQTTASAGPFGADVRMVCWGTWDGASPPIVDYGLGVESAVLTLTPVGGFG